MLNLLFKDISLGKWRVRAAFEVENDEFSKAKKVVGSLARFRFPFIGLFVPFFQETMAFFVCFSAVLTI